jgi:quaternary ammonium compound-resistance protein SugE
MAHLDDGEATASGALRDDRGRDANACDRDLLDVPARRADATAEAHSIFHAPPPRRQDDGDDPAAIPHRGRPLPRMEHAMNWLILVAAGLFEIGWAIGLKYTEGFTRPWPSVATAFAMIVSLGLLGIAMKSLPVGTAYAVWVGVGAVGTAILGIVLFGEPANGARLLSLALILAGILGLTLATPA